MAVERWIIDKSALVRLTSSPDTEAWRQRINRGLVHISTITRLEFGFSARNADEWVANETSAPMKLMPTEYMTPSIETRALDVQRLLAQKGQHRAASIPDLLVAASGEMASLTILHFDKDFDLIAEITGQKSEWLAHD